MKTELFNFTIKIETDSNDFNNIKREVNLLLYNELKVLGVIEYDDNENTGNHNYVNEFLKYSVKKSFNSEGFTVFITDYQEKSGSFIVLFGLLIFQKFLDYGSLRQSVDYFITDTKSILNKLTKHNTVINFRQNTDQLPTTNASNNPIVQYDNNRAYDNYNLTNRIMLIILIVLSTLILGFEISSKFLK